jgi:protein-S-isoprenylcysteine O-methyltransferase Ste14
VWLGEFLVFSNWILLVYMAGAACLIHRQVLREEQFLRKHYGQEYFEYSARVRRYF